MNLLTQSIGGAISATATTPVKLLGAARNLLVQGALAYGAGGTTVDAWLQTTIDGTNWIDIANFHFTTGAGRFVYNLNGQTPVTTEYTPTDGSLAANTCKDGILGSQFRVKYQSTGTYTGTTVLTVDVATDQITG